MLIVHPQQHHQPVEKDVLVMSAIGMESVSAPDVVCILIYKLKSNQCSKYLIIIIIINHCKQNDVL